jgi:two-component system NtrC family sensor kinase
LLSKWPIRVKLFVGLGLLVLVVAILSSSGLYATYAYRSLVASLSWRVTELPVAAELSQRVGDLRITLSELQGMRRLGELQANSFLGAADAEGPSRVWWLREQFSADLGRLDDTLSAYRSQLENEVQADLRMGDNRPERETVHRIEVALLRIRQANRDADWMLDDVKVGQLKTELEELQNLAAELPSHLHHKLGGFRDEVRGQYRTLIVGTWITSISAALLFGLFMRLSWQWILQPLRILIRGSRRVAAGQFDYRIHLDTQDEMAELAEALNDMTARFRDIRDDLDRQVQERTKQAVRSEQLASVGFLAAGVAHEINNPLASIAMCAESLESRIREVFEQYSSATPAAENAPGPTSPAKTPLAGQLAVISNYLRMVQNEAFRCKEITERLLDFSRTSQAKRENTDLGQVVRAVVRMVGHLGKYQQKQIRFTQSQPVVAPVNAQEIKQVVLNLLTNALDSLDDGGTVWIELGARGGMAVLTFLDNGCGMETEVLEHVFEPFFTRRRQGQGTGLGLSITYRIVADHGGEIRAESPGPGQGATFRVSLPLGQTQQQGEDRYQAA